MSDKASSNVVRMDAPEKSPSRLTRQESIHLLNDCRDMASERLCAAMPGLSEETDNALYDLAGKVADDKDRGRYFDLISELRMRKDELVENFSKELAERYGKKARSSEGTAAAPGLSLDDMELSLVDNDDLEESLAVTNAVSAITNACQEELFALDRRMEVLLQKRQLDTADNPLGPEVICKAFKAAHKDIALLKDVRIVIFKSFERVLIPEIKEIYQDINQHFLDHGVLPKIRTGISRHPRRPARPGPNRGGSPSEAETLSEAVGGAEMQDVFAAFHQMMGGSARVPGEASTFSGRNPQAFDTLTQLQHGKAGDLLTDTTLFDPSMLATGDVNVLGKLRSTSFTKDMGETDVLTLDVVSMLFDFVLEDKNLPAAMQALIGRLQIPVLKAAMLDKSMFSKRNHPVRSLLDTLADAALGWNEAQGQDDPLYRKVDGIVQRVLNEFEDDLAIFQELLGELEAFLEEQKTRADEQVEESAGVLEGRERLALASAMAQDEVLRRTEGEEVPDAVRQFLGTHWKELLSLIYLKDGEETEEWASSIETMDQLVDSVSPKAAPEARSRLLGSLPGLLKRLREGMKLVSMPAAERDQFLSELAAMHGAMVRTGSPAAARPSSGVGGSAQTQAPQGLAAPPDGDPHAQVTQDIYSPETRLLQAACDEANSVIYRTAQGRLECTGMGTTLVGALFHDDHLVSGHVGDSRLYRLRGDSFEQLTKDHSLLQQLIDQGYYTPEEAEKSTKKNFITRAMGVQSEVEMEFHEHPVSPGDIYLLCSDGLSDLVGAETIHSTVRESQTDFEALAQTLVGLANEAGGKDNISVLLVRVKESFPAKANDEGPRNLADRLEVHSLTDVGRKRSHNEDCIGSDGELGLVILADGMGGYNAGEVASELAVKTIVGELRREFGLPSVAVTPEADADALAEIALEGEPAGLAEREEDAEKYIEIVKGLEVGAWIEFRRGEESAKLGRLTWISPSGATYLFTDRDGAKVADATPTALALELLRGTAAIVEDAPMFDRAVSSIVSQLKENTPALA